MWCIVLHYEPFQLFESAIPGPSSNALNLIDCKAHDTLVDDCVSDKDISLLLGVTNHGSIWPTLDLWQNNKNWSGEWSKKLERWFTAHMREIDRGSPLVILTQQQWKVAVCRHTVMTFNNICMLGIEAHAAWVCSQSAEFFPPSLTLTLESS